MTRSSAHSACWQSAFGHACTKTTPWVDRRCTGHLHRLDRSRLPLRTHRFGDALYSAVTEQGSRTQSARWRPDRASPGGAVGTNVTQGHSCVVLPLVKRITMLPAVASSPSGAVSGDSAARGGWLLGAAIRCVTHLRLAVTHSSGHHVSVPAAAPSGGKRSGAEQGDPVAAGALGAVHRG